MVYDTRVIRRIDTSQEFNALELRGAAELCGNRIEKEKNASIKLLFINRLKILFGAQSRIDNVADVIVAPDILTLTTKRGNRQRGSFSMTYAPNSRAPVAALLVSGRADRRWLLNRERSREAGQTPSNLG